MKKKWIAGYLGIFSCLVVVAQHKVPANLIGKWENIQNKEVKSGLEFSKSDSVFLFFDEEKKLPLMYKLMNLKNRFGLTLLLMMEEIK